tara:strand:+ start:22 stop:225 length:204 start_codon:yes stop_codon:yes gene_type:complete
MLNGRNLTKVCNNDLITEIIATAFNPCFVGVGDLLPCEALGWFEGGLDPGAGFGLDPGAGFGLCAGL